MSRDRRQELATENADLIVQKKLLKKRKKKLCEENKKLTKENEKLKKELKDQDVEWKKLIYLLIGRGFRAIPARISHKPRFISDHRSLDQPTNG